jgi:hypothetical protein
VLEGFGFGFSAVTASCCNRPGPSNQQSMVEIVLS